MLRKPCTAVSLRNRSRVHEIRTVSPSNWVARSYIRPNRWRPFIWDYGRKTNSAVRSSRTQYTNLMRASCRRGKARHCSEPWSEPAPSRSYCRQQTAQVWWMFRRYPSSRTATWSGWSGWTQNLSLSRPSSWPRSQQQHSTTSCAWGTT